MWPYTIILLNSIKTNNNIEQRPHDNIIWTMICAYSELVCILVH